MLEFGQHSMSEAVRDQNARKTIANRRKVAEKFIAMVICWNMASIQCQKQFEIKMLGKRLQTGEKLLRTFFVQCPSPP